ncbi:UDP-4-amino-4,6-dideoxy-N-acetyl-beta-L-altrosamine N-acetyltransferase [sulfur-oxidizing endosymbiont of Gigantopelta aegis]|uniref:UDP-4-amino-4, 6-dideoxy-N-acetyl-beta-L-altrosamine N-acetyltransferase n=1 Tax=sulfur-oxidizing endosymbiont of Gigantopelta aegis TaxID=2794934 RepID=UPI002483D3BD|nr:UDP-4-amino-4,6-dideoxy-N-acetyl-beta-L-altrosamine N-acetyltransferase [sulfur-oxidizing endosymbiont of Gigantopelta aegis]
MLIPLTEHYLDTILVWRNQSEVRHFSFNDTIISPEEHYRWWERIKTDITKQWMVYLHDGKAAGVVNYYDIIEYKEAFWGFYFSDQFADYEKLKLWFKIEHEAITFAFDTMKLQKLKCEVFKMNKAALIMHKRIGYQKIDTYEHVRGTVQVLELDKYQMKSKV